MFWNDFVPALPTSIFKNSQVVSINGINFINVHMPKRDDPSDQQRLYHVLERMLAHFGNEYSVLLGDINNRRMITPKYGVMMRVIPDHLYSSMHHEKANIPYAVDGALVHRSFSHLHRIRLGPLDCPVVYPQKRHNSPNHCKDVSCVKSIPNEAWPSDHVPIIVEVMPDIA
jgi:hypothetical protein